jgi:hypothetical protein
MGHVKASSSPLGINTITMPVNNLHHDETGLWEQKRKF